MFTNPFVENSGRVFWKRYIFNGVKCHLLSNIPSGIWFHQDLKMSAEKNLVENNTIWYVCQHTFPPAKKQFANLLFFSNLSPILQATAHSAKIDFFLQH